jgi:Heparinase II/III-like protein
MPESPRQTSYVKRHRISALAALCLTAVAALLTSCTSKMSGREILAKIHPGHPRLMMTPNTIATIQANLPKDPWLQKQYRGQKKDADRFLSEPVSVYRLHGRDDMVDISRKVLERVSTLALVYHIEGDRKYLDRCWLELDNAGHFHDWGPRQFLDTAEMTAAFAIAYDWLFDAWTPEQRQSLRRSIVDMGLKPGLIAYDTQKWPHQVDNHNTVNNGGLILGALAIADEEPGIAGKILARAISSDPHSLSQFAPDGAWPEGPMYWGYATEYESMSLAALETACGTDFGLAGIPGIDQAGWFPIYDNGPVDGTFNFADAIEDHERRSGPQLLWMAQRFHEPRFAQYERDFPNGRVSALDVIWGAGIDHQPWQALPTDRYFRGVELATMRDDWDKPDGWFVGFKAGSNNVSHSHLDVGSFVLEAKGVRWAIDLGPSDTDLPGYSDDDGQRWIYYRLRAEGHNTLVLNPGSGPDQDHNGAGRITSFASSPQGVELTADLTGVYPSSNRVVRSLSFTRGKSVKLSDAVQLPRPGEVWWFLQTRAGTKPSADGRTLTLRQNGQTLSLKLVQPSSARFEVGPSESLPTSPHPSGQPANPGVSRISIHLSSVKDTTISVQFEN